MDAKNKKKTQTTPPSIPFYPPLRRPAAGPKGPGGHPVIKALFPGSEVSNDREERQKPVKENYFPVPTTPSL